MKISKTKLRKMIKEEVSRFTQRRRGSKPDDMDLDYFKRKIDKRIRRDLGEVAYDLDRAEFKKLVEVVTSLVIEGYKDGYDSGWGIGYDHAEDEYGDQMARMASKQ